VVGILLDTCVISELRRPQPDASVVDRVMRIDTGNLFLSVITIGEIVKGIELLDSSERKRQLEQWLLRLEQDYADRLLSIDTQVARIWGELTARAQNHGIQIPASDGLIAATALRNGLHVMTRNSRHFAATGAIVIDPWID